MGRLFGRDQPGKRETQAGLGTRLGNAHRELDVGGLAFPGHARGTRGAGHARFIEQDEKPGGVAALEGEVGGVRQAVGGVAVPHAARNALDDKFLKSIPHVPDPIRRAILHGQLGKPRGLTHRDDPSYVLRAAAPTAFLPATVEQWGEIQPTADIERAHTFRPVELVRGKGEQVDRVAADIDGDFSHRLHRIGMNGQAEFVSDGDHLRKRLDHAGLVVGGHHGNIRRTTASCAEGIGIEPTVRTHHHLHDIPFSALHEPQHCAVLDGGDNRRPLPRQLVERMQRGVHALGAGAGENDLALLRADQCRDLAARLVDGLPRQLRRPVGAGGVRVVPAKPRKHRFHHFGKHRRGRVGIEVNHGASFGLHRGKTMPKHAQSLTAIACSQRSTASPQVIAVPNHE